MDIEWIMKLRDEVSGSLANIQKNLLKMKDAVTGISSPAKEASDSIKQTTDSTFDLGTSLAQTTGAIAGTADNLADLTGQGKETTKGLKLFEAMQKKVRFGFLAMGFLGMQMTRTFGFLNEEIMKVYYAGELMNIQFALIWAAAPTFEFFSDILFGLADVFYALPEPVQAFFGTLFPLLSFIGSILTQVGFLAFGLTGLGNLFGMIGISASTAGIAVGGMTIAFGPLLLIIGAIIAIIVLLWLAWQSNFANIRGFAEEVWNALKVIFEGLWEIIEGFFEFFTGIVELDGDKIVRGIAKICEGMKKIFVDGLGGILIAVVKFVANVIIEFIKWGDKLLGILGTAFVGALKSFADWFASVIKGAWDFGVNFIKAIVNGIISVGSMIGNAIWNVIPEPFKSWIQGAGNFIGGIAQGIGNIVGNIGNMLGFGDMIWRAGEKPVRISPQDNIIATKGNEGQSLNFAPTINISANLNYPTDADALGRRIMDSMYTELKRRTM